MPVSAQQLSNVANAALKWYIKGQAAKQEKQPYRLLERLRSRARKFGGGQDLKVARNIKGNPSTTFGFKGFSDDDKVEFGYGTNLIQGEFPAREHHLGLKLTYSHLKRNGIKLDKSTGKNARSMSMAERARISNLFEEEMDDLMEAANISLAKLLWGDGSSDSKAIVGMQAVVSNTPTSGVLGGINPGTVSFYQNRALVGANKITASKSNQTLTETLKKELRQLTRHGRGPTDAFAGADAMHRLEQEARAKGTLTDRGFAQRLNLDVGDLGFGQLTIEYEPVLDDLGLGDFIYMLDLNNIRLYELDGDDMEVIDNPRPSDQFVMLKSLVYTATLACWQRNTSGVYETAG